MDGLASDLKGIVAPLSFLVPMADKPVAYNYDPPPGTPMRTGKQEDREVLVHDGRAVAGQLLLDHQGFVLGHGPTAVGNFYDENQIVSIFYAECEEIVKRATGANRALAFDHIVRNEAKAAIKGSGVKMPSARVHNDYTTSSSPQRVRDLMGPQGEQLLKQRYAIINLWRPIAGPLLRNPLALCDAESLEEENLVVSELRYPDRVGETYSVTYNQHQRWFYFPRMAADEYVLIRCFDSARDGAARFSAHGGFTDPTTPPSAPPRESIEVRMVVFFPPGA
ncbi:MAG: CmcJ/NvfI family oxidoreductase [Stellaceae bacterium]